MNNYYQPPNFNQSQYNYDETAKKNAFYIEKAALEIRQIKRLGNIFGLTMTVYVAVNVLSSFFLLFPSVSNLYNSSALFQTCFGILAVDLVGLVAVFGIMAYINRKKYSSELIPAEKLSFKEGFLWIGFGMFFCIIANYAVNFIVYLLQAAGHDPFNVETPKPDSFITSIAIAIGTAVMPALCEEFAMRCCGIGMLKNHGKAFAVICVSLVFGLLHGNFVQFVFASLIGLILGYVTVKTNSVIPAVFIHMFNNGISVITSISEYVFKTESNASVGFWFALWFIIGGISTVILLVKGYFRNNAEKINEPYQNSLGKKVTSFFLVPGMIVPFLFFVYTIIVSIR